MNKSDMKTKFLSLIEQNKRIIYKITYSYCRDEENRKDLIQEIIIQLWNSFSRYDEKRKWSTWMYRITLNVAISFHRKDMKRKNFESPFKDNIIEVIDENEESGKEQNITLLHDFIDQLNRMDKSLIILYLDNISYNNIAEILGITETNVATKISRIKTKLKHRFSTMGEG